jgi:hypothetical protein
MAGTDDNTTAITLISLAAARELVVETLLSAPWAKQLIIKWLYLRRVRWQYEMVLGQPAPGRTFEQEAEDLWAQPTRVLVDWQEGYACRVTVYRKDRAGCLKPLCRITVIGIRVVREDIERQLAQMPRALLGSVAAGKQLKPLEDPPPKKPLRKTGLKDWLPDAIKRLPRPRGEKDYAGYLLQHAPEPWSKHSIQNALSELAPQKKRKPKKS